jgi:hypothetical protein
MLISIVNYTNKRQKGKRMNKEIEIKMKRRLKYLEKKLGSLGSVMRGSLVVIGTKNKQPYFSLNKNKKTKLIYLGEKREAVAKGLSDNYKNLCKIVEEMTEINMELLKEIGKKV